MDIQDTAMNLIAGAGDSRSYSLEALDAAKEGRFDEARELVAKASEAMVSTHDMQTQLIRDEMTGRRSEITLLMVHAQDHLNMAMLTRDLVREFITLYERLPQQKEENV